MYLYYQGSLYNTITLGAPAIHHMRFANGGLRKIKQIRLDANKRLCSLQEMLSDLLFLYGNVEDILDQTAALFTNSLAETTNSTRIDLIGRLTISVKVLVHVKIYKNVSFF